MTAIQQITAVAASLGWEVKTDIQQKKRVEFEFQRYTKMGQDFFFTVGMKGNDTGSLISEIEDYYEGFGEPVLLLQPRRCRVRLPR